MNEHDARQVLLVRTLETPPGIHQWPDDDRDWASRAAAQETGEQASSEAFVVRRAALAVERLKSRLPQAPAVLEALAWRAWVTPAVGLAALLCGLLLDAAVASRRINILAPPLLALLLWNLAVYAVLAVSTRLGRDTDAPARGSRPLNRLMTRLASTAAGLRPRDPLSPLARFVADWTVASGPLTAARSQTALHLAAAAFAAGALAGLYFRGLAFEYLAGWESTFLDAPAVRALLGAVLGPASLLTGIALPDAAHLATLRFSAGPGENAGRWIHLHAVTIGLAVILPRLLLAASALRRSRRLAARFPLSLGDAYFQGLDRRHRGRAAEIDVVPYGLALPARAGAALTSSFRAAYGGDARVQLLRTVAPGQEDELATLLPADWPRAGAAAPTLIVALYALAATPERETHGAFLRGLADRVGGTAPIAVLIDESAMRQRFGADATRLESRRNAWRKLLRDSGATAPVFVSLDGSDDSGPVSSLRQLIDEISVRLGQNAGMLPARVGPAAS